MPRYTKLRGGKLYRPKILVSLTLGKISVDIMTSNKSTSVLEKVSKLLESISKRATQTDTNDRNDILETAKSQQKIHSLKLMAVVYESLMACRDDNSGSQDFSKKNDKDCATGSVNISQRINGIYKEYTQFIGFGNRITRFVKGEEENKLNSLFKGYNEIIRLSKKVNKPDSIFYQGYNQVIDYSKRFAGYKKDDEKNESNRANATNEANGYFNMMKQIPYSIGYGAYYWVYKPASAYATKEQAYQVLRKSDEALWYVVQNAVQLFHNAKSLKDMDREGYKKLLQDLCSLLSKTIPSDVSKLLTVSCIIKTLHALAQVHLEETGEVMPTVPSILLDSISILLQMVGFESPESTQVIQWLRNLAFTQSVETLIVILFIQLLLIIKDIYARDGKTLDNLFSDLCWKLGMIESTDTSVTNKMYKWWRP